MFVASQSGDGSSGAAANQADSVRLGLYYLDTELHYDIALQPNATAFSVLDGVARVEYAQYDYGKLVTAINGVGQDDNHYWLFFVNGGLPPLSADSYVVHPGDLVEFRYLDSATAMGYFSE